MIQAMDLDSHHNDSSGDIAYRLPSLKPNYQDLGALQKTKQCPRESRVLAAFEDVLDKKKQNRLLKQSEKTHVKLQGRIDGIEASETKSFLSRLLDIELSTPHNTADVVGYLVRELTEVGEAIEKSKDILRKETIKGLWKVIAGVLHSMGQENLKRAFEFSTPISKYENYSKALSLSPRFFRKLEKREPVYNTPQVCKGCQVGGPLPWLYLYPDREIYRTGGGFDCLEFHLPVLRSEKTLTIPKDPFSRSRGKLVETRVHRLPAKRKANPTKAKSFKLQRQIEDSDVSLTLPRLDTNYSSSVTSDTDQRDSVARSLSMESVVLLGKNAKGSSSSMKQKSRSLNETGEERAILEAEKDPKKEFSSTASSQRTNNVVTFEKNTNEQIHDEILTDNEREKASGIPKKLNSNLKMQSSSNKVSSLGKQSKELASETKATESDWTQRFKAKLSLNTPKKRELFNVVHNSTLLTDRQTDFTEKRMFEGRKVITTKHSGSGRRKKSSEMKGIPIKRFSSMTGSASIKEESTSMASFSDLSLRFSSSLSLNYPETEATENELSEFSLMGAKMKPATRKSTADMYNPPGYGKRSTRSDSSIGKFGGSSSKKDNGKTERKSKKSSASQVSSDLGTSLASSSINRDTTSANLTGISLTSGIASDMVMENEGSLENEEVDFWGSESSFLNEKSNYEVDNEDDFNFNNDWEQEQDESTFEAKKRRKAKRKRTLQYRMEPLSTYTLRRGSRTESEIPFEEEEDLSMLDYAAKYCIISLERLSKYENIFNTYSSCEPQDDETNEINRSSIDADIVGETEKQKSLLQEYEKLVYGMDVYQQRISEADKKKVEMIRQQQGTMESVSNSSLDQAQKKLLETSIQAMSPRIDAVENRVKQFLGKLKKMMEKKRELQEALRESGMEDEKIEKLIKNTDFLERRFMKMKNQQINIENLPAALRVVNRNFDNEDFKFVNRILQLPKKESLDFKAFAIVAALSERVGSLDKSIKALLREVDLGTLERKLDKCKELYRLLSEENPDNGRKLVSVDNLAVELQAGGLEEDHQKSVISKLDHHGQGFVDFLDFVLYVPLFLMIHDQIISQPFSVDSIH